MKKIVLLSCLLVFLITPAALWALTITPDTLPKWTGTANNVPDIKNELLTKYGINLGEDIYKQEIDPSAESGYFADSYKNTFNENGGTLSYEEGKPSIEVKKGTYLLVKDGKNNPSWYLFDLSNLWNGSEYISWDGKEDIVLNNFWPNQGGISYVAISRQVPEPMTLLFLGTGLLGLAIIRRKKR
jgi:hypothetical protein